MARHVPGGADVMDALGGGYPDRETRDWLRQQSEAVYQTLPQQHQAFFDSARERFQMIDEIQATQIQRNVERRADTALTLDTVRYLNHLEDIQTAGIAMQRWIMASPYVRKRYFNQTTEGYTDTYKNHYGNVVGDNHYDYWLAMDGVGHTAGEDETFQIKHYHHLLAKDDRRLTTSEKMDIQSTWAMVQSFFEEGDEDPLSPSGTPL